MTPEQIELSRKLMALPGAPALRVAHADGYGRTREFDGRIDVSGWTGDGWYVREVGAGDGHPHEVLLQLDDANGGRLLCQMAAARWCPNVVHWGRACQVSGMAFDPDVIFSVIGDSLAEACAQCIISVGRWPEAAL